jgi:hypothetical protein
MENLINFEDENENLVVKKDEEKTPIKRQHLLVQERISLDLNNPFDKFEYRATHLNDPFECLEIKQDPAANKMKFSSSPFQEFVT